MKLHSVVKKSIVPLSLWEQVSIDFIFSKEKVLSHEPSNCCTTPWSILVTKEMKFLKIFAQEKVWWHKPLICSCSNDLNFGFVRDYVFGSIRLTQTFHCTSCYKIIVKSLNFLMFLLLTSFFFSPVGDHEDNSTHAKKGWNQEWHEYAIKLFFPILKCVKTFCLLQLSQWNVELLVKQNDGFFSALATKSNSNEWIHYICNYW